MKPRGSEFVTYEKQGSVAIDLKAYLKSAIGKVRLRRRQRESFPQDPVENGVVMRLKSPPSEEVKQK